MIVLDEGKGYIVKIGCPYCNAMLGLNLKDIKRNTICGNSKYNSKCSKCEMEFNIPEELIPYGVKLSLKKRY